MNNYRRRDSIRLHGYDYSQNGAYFITMCTKNREEIFGHIVGVSDGEMILTDIGEIAKTNLVAIDDHYRNVRMIQHVIMPNHIHAILLIEYDAADEKLKISKTTGAPRRAPTLGNVVCGYKSGMSKLCGFSPWQRGYHDRIIRNQDEYNRISEYIQNNPVHWESDRFYQKNDSKKSNRMTLG